MNGILLTCRSVTYAQKMKRMLENNGIAASIVRPDINLTKGSCAYAVNISQVFLPEAVSVLRSNMTPPIKIILIERNNLYRELHL